MLMRCDFWTVFAPGTPKGQGNIRELEFIFHSFAPPKKGLIVCQAMAHDFVIVKQWTSMLTYLLHFCFLLLLFTERILMACPVSLFTIKSKCFVQTPNYLRRAVRNRPNTSSPCYISDILNNCFIFISPISSCKEPGICISIRWLF